MMWIQDDKIKIQRQHNVHNMMRYKMIKYKIQILRDINLQQEIKYNKEYNNKKHIKTYTTRQSHIL